MSYEMPKNELLNIEKLHGRENYSSYAIKNYSEIEDLWRCVTEAEIG